MRAPETTHKRIDGTSIIRFDVHQRAQHALLLFSFAFLAITGLPLKYSDSAVSGWWLGLWGGVGNTRAVHRFAAWVMIADCAYHLLYLLLPVAVLRRPFPSAMLPRFQDIRDLVQHIKHSLGFSKEPPKFDRFSYRNKFNYWFVWCGVIIIVGSGLILITYPRGAADELPRWIYPLALIVHGDAAILAIGWMLVVHMYFAHFARGVFPGDKSIFTGKVPFKRYRKDFPLEFTRIMAAAGLPVTAAEETTPADPEEPPEDDDPSPGDEKPCEVERPSPEDEEQSPEDQSK
jgi:formate dehydrogenase subunit gamma